MIDIYDDRKSQIWFQDFPFEDPLFSRTPFLHLFLNHLFGRRTSMLRLFGAKRDKSV